MSKIILSKLADNLEGLKSQEEQIRIDSCLLINSDQKLQEHIKLIHASMDALMWMYKRTDNIKNNQLIALTSLKIRLFNSISCCLKLLLSGYYQGAISPIRDVLEITFLLDYFTLDSESIERWVADSNSKEFKQVAIREKLDDRDGLHEMKRKYKYQLLSTYGTHATFDGNKLYNNNNLLTLGPFFNQKFLENILFELAVLQPEPILSLMSFESNLTISDFHLKKEFLINTQSWWKSNMNEDFHDSQLDEIDRLLGYAT
ncbi:MAG: hypothetical protein BVN34_07025 [Proteobacteria bacterium ST_bin12]|nr:MAG: hypothetical protein BVN34_07025 [Proteobacteria bacterium ST_bin12]